MTRIFAPPRPAVKPSREGIFPDPDEHREPYTQADLEWAAAELNEHATDEELEWPGTRDEFERWLDSLAPTDGELEHRERLDAFLGHD